ncbi:unnamed protein product [Trichobilharzia szidati]|nr:unnamed protein product [Trichobilharzia szidati]
MLFNEVTEICDALYTPFINSSVANFLTLILVNNTVIRILNHWRDNVFQKSAHKTSVCGTLCGTRNRELLTEFIYQNVETLWLRCGQEASTLEYDDEVKITPFNMKEELEEDGHFDSAGTFIFKKEVDARDNWLEDINWLEVKKNQEKNVLKDTAISDEPDEKVLSKEEKLSMYQELLSYLQPSETVLRSIKRMGACSDVKKSASASERWLQKKKPKTDNRNGNPEGLIRVTELADQLVQAGDFDVYQKTYEDIHKLIECTKQFEADDELDVLGQELDEKQSSNNNKITTTKMV